MSFERERRPNLTEDELRALDLFAPPQSAPATQGDEANEESAVEAIVHDAQAQPEPPARRAVGRKRGGAGVRTPPRPQRAPANRDRNQKRKRDVNDENADPQGRAKRSRAAKTRKD